MISSFISSVLNHLLSQEPQAAAKLSRHAGKVACIDAGITALRLKVAGDGLLHAAEELDAANVTIRIKPADLPLIAQDVEHAFAYVRIEGDADFANAISELSRTLHWEPEEDLSKLIGDIAAPRLMAATRGLAGGILSAQRKLAENTAEYLLEENPMLMRPQSVSEFADDVARLRDDVERLAKRVEKLKERSGV